MSFDDRTRKLLSKAVTGCRRKLMEDTTRQLRGVFGLHPDGTVLALDELTHLSPDQAAAASQLRDLLDHYSSGTAGKELDRRKAAYERMVLEISFTVLNRLAALRLCEERGLVVECVRKGMSSDGFQMFERVSGGALGPRYATYRVFLECLFDELALDLGLLFDRTAPQSAIFPSERCMEDVLDELNKSELTHLWTEDETIGWVYQYFNPPEERKAMRDASQAPRNSRELAVRNQFFTPRYVVEFLTDNTLGHLWYEMRKGETALKEECRYLVRHPREVFLFPMDRFSFPRRPELASASDGDFSALPEPESVTWDEIQSLALAIDGYAVALSFGIGDCLEFWSARKKEYQETGRWAGDGLELWCCLFAEQRAWHNQDEDPEGEFWDAILALYGALRIELQKSSSALSKEELLNQPVFIAQRPKKDPRDLRVLDPACGSGHFLLYAFDLLERIYQEAWADPESPRAVEVSGPDGKSAAKKLSQDYPTMEALQREVPKLIIEHNLHGIDIDQRAVQIAALALWLRAQKTWKHLNVKPVTRPRIERSNIVTAEPMPGEEEIRGEFMVALKPRVLGQLVEVIFDKMKFAGEAGSLLKIEEVIKSAVADAKEVWLLEPRAQQQELFAEIRKQTVTQGSLFDVSTVSDERFWAQAEEGILSALKRYAEHVENGHGTPRRLFAEDAARGFAFIDLCRKRYDVALMNPPFGQSSTMSYSLIKAAFGKAAFDLFACFLQRGLELLNPTGVIGAITTSAGFYRNQVEEWRSSFFLGGSLRCCADLGGHVLDGATVRAATYVRDAVPNSGRSTFVRCNESEDKGSFLLTSVQQMNIGVCSSRTFLVDTKRLNQLPGRPLAYWLPQQFQRDIAKLQRFADAGGDAQFGLSTKDDFRFLRLAWEVHPQLIGQDRPWCFTSKGGVFSPFYFDIHLVVFHASDFRVLEQAILHKYPYLGDNASWVLHRENKYYQPGITFQRRTNKPFAPRVLPAGCLFTDNGPSAFWDSCSLPAFLALFNSSPVRLLAAVGNGAIEAEGGGGANSYEVGIINNIVVPPLPSKVCEALESTSLRVVRLKQQLDRNEPDTRSFVAPVVTSITEYISSRASIENEIQDLVRQIDGLVNPLYGFSAAQLDELMASVTPDADDDVDAEPMPQSGRKDLIHNRLSSIIGYCFGRWDIRMAMDSSLVPNLPDPFDPLPICPPAALVGPDGLPASPGEILSAEWLCARPAVNTLPPEGSVKSPTIPDSDYPLRISWDGLLVDDPGVNGTQSRKDDIIRRVREVLDLLWKDKAHEIEQEACDILGVSDLRDYFRKPAGFFQDHLKRYSKSRRKAPIYWPLSTASGSYTIWLYYHRLTDQTIYAAVNKYVNRKAIETQRWIARIEGELKAASGREASRLNDRLRESQLFLGEIMDLREELLRIAALPYKPNLNDGVIINAAPLNKLFRMRQWAKDTEGCWKKLQKGDYDWAHLAYSIWPDRVRKVCKTDRSIAIVHGLEDLCEIGAMARKKKSGRRKKEVIP